MLSTEKLLLQQLQRNLFVYLFITTICVSWRKHQSSFPNAICELEQNFNYKNNQIADDILKKSIE